MAGTNTLVWLVPGAWLGVGVQRGRGEREREEEGPALVKGPSVHPSVRSDRCARAPVRIPTEHQNHLSKHQPTTVVAIVPILQ